MASPGKTDHSNDDLPFCKYGALCYRKNPVHFEEFQHSEKVGSGVKRDHSDDSLEGSSKEEENGATAPKRLNTLDESSASSSGASTFHYDNPFGFYFTQARGLAPQWNSSTIAKDISDLLKMDADKMVSSVQFNYMVDLPWLVKKYPEISRQKPLLVVTSPGGNDFNGLREDAIAYNERFGTKITVVQARLPIPYGTHHTKMMILKYEHGLRVIVHTANLIEQDWDQKTQGIFMTPLLQKACAEIEGDFFKSDLTDYLREYKLGPLETVIKELETYDMTCVKAKLIASIPGRFQGNDCKKWGHLKLRSLLEKFVTSTTVEKSWATVAQFSSIGSLGTTPEQWLLGEFRQSLMATSSKTKDTPKAPFQLLFPSVENVRTSLEGYAAGGSLPYSIENARKQGYLKQYLHQWRSECRGRTRASPHIKTYTRISPCLSKLGWFLVTSANLSKAAWGVHEKNGAQFMVRSYELGVLFLPSDYGKDYFSVIPDVKDEIYFPLPYDLPLLHYDKDDEPWITDIPYLNKTDSRGVCWNRGPRKPHN